MTAPTLSRERIRALMLKHGLLTGNEPQNEAKLIAAIPILQDAYAAGVATGEADRRLLKNASTTMHHARTFLTSREKMHPDGVVLFDRELAEIDAALAQTKEQTDAKP